MKKAAQVALPDEANEQLGIHPGNGMGVVANLESEDRLFLLLRLFWNERGHILRMAAYIGMLTLAMGLLTPNSYRSTTRLMPPENQSGAAGLAALLAGKPGSADIGLLAGNMLGMKSTGATFVAILQSRTAEESIVDQFDLTSVYGSPRLHLRVSKDNAIKELEHSTEIGEDHKSGVITISVVNSDPKLASQLAHAYVDQLNRLIAGLSTSAARREREFLEQRLTEVMKDLQDASRELSEFSSKNATLDPKEQGRAMVGAAASLEGELIASESQLKGLEAIYTTNNVRVRSLRARIDELKKQLGNVSGGTSTTITPPGEAANPDMVFPSMRQLPFLGAAYADLFRRAKTQETVYELLTQQYEIAKVEEAKEIPTVRVLDTADVPRLKWGPHRVLWVLLGTIVGLLVGCVWVIAIDRWNHCGSHNPYKILLSEVLVTSRKQWLWKKCSAVLYAIRPSLSRGKTPFNNEQ